MAHVHYRPAESLFELNQVLELQKLNLPEALSAEQQEKEGFVTLRYTLDQLSLMNQHCPQIIALEKDLVIGYALCLHPGLKKLVPQLRPLFQLLADERYQRTDYRIMGQICIRKGYRGKGHFSGIYHYLIDRVRPLPLITEISLRNNRSLHAHYKLGFRKLVTRQDADNPWDVVIWE
jgi:hypothetical protein